RLGMTRRNIDAKEIVERILFPMVNEGARILDEKVAQRPGDIDIIWVYGYGFPAWRGGPMHYADTCELAYVCDRLRSFAAKAGDPPPQADAFVGAPRSRANGVRFAR